MCLIYVVIFLDIDNVNCIRLATVSCIWNLRRNNNGKKKVVFGRGEQSLVITEITDQKLKPELEPNRTVLNWSGFGFVFQHPNPTELNQISHPIYITPAQIQFSES